MQLLHLSFTYT